MNKELQAYLPYYIGQEVAFGFEGRKSVGTLVGRDERYGWQVFDLRSTFVPYKFCNHDWLTLRLRPLSDMTPEEADIFQSKIKSNETKVIPWEGIRTNAEAVSYLLKQGFDLFDLIPAGLAVDKTK